MKNMHNKILIVIGLLFYSIILPAQTTTSRIWGVTKNGGISNYGVIYSTKPNGSDYTVEFKFDANSSNISKPNSNLAYGIDGNFYGISRFYSAPNQIINNKYILYKYNPSTKQISKLETIIDAETWITTTPDKKHLLFSKSSGGAKGVGAIMRYTINADYLIGSQTDKLFTLRSFTNTAGGDYINGYNMETMPVMPWTKELYGTCHNSAEPDANQGILFVLDDVYKSNPTPRLLEKFNSGTEDNNGKWHKGLLYQKIGRDYLFWQTSAGGDNNEGVIYEYRMDHGTLRKIHDFNNSSPDITKRGKRPFGDLVYTHDKLYGTTYEGGTNDNGVIFSIDVTNYDYKIIKNIDNNNASYSYRSMGRGLFFSSNGKLYGTAEYGNTRPSSTDGGMIFCIDQWNNDSYSVVKTFQATSEGENPYFELTEVNDCLPTSITINWPTGMTHYPTIKSHCGIVTEDDLMLDYEIGGSTEKRRLIATNDCGDTINFRSYSSFPIDDYSKSITLLFNDRKGNEIKTSLWVEIENEIPVPIVTNLPEIQSFCEISLDNADFPKAEEECDGVIIGVPTIKGSNNAPQWPLTENTTIVWEYKSSKGKTITQEQQFTISKINTNIIISGNSLTSEQTNSVTYKWQTTNGGTKTNPWVYIDKVMGKTYKATKNGKYRVEMTPINGGCSITYSNEVTIGNLEIEDLEKALGIKVFPNPTRGLLQLERTSSIKINIEVVDITGKYILSTKTSKKNIALDLRTYPNGIYNLIITDDKKSYSIRIIKK